MRCLQHAAKCVYLLFKLRPSNGCIEGLRALLHWKLATYLAHTMMYQTLSFLKLH